jgi:hypothetical protein
MPSNRSGTNISGTNNNDDWQPHDPYADDSSSEFSWGDGLTPKGLENAPPSEGGRYRGTSPPSGPQVGVSRR